MRLALIAYCLGLMSGALVLDLHSALIFAAVCLAGSALVFLLLARIQRHRPRLAAGCISFIVGFAWHCLWASAILQQRLPLELEGIDMQVEGVVLSLPSQKPNAQQFSFRILHGEHEFADRTVLLNYYGAVSIEPGQHWHFLLRLNRPHGFANPTSFDYEAWLFQRGISAKGYVRPSEVNRLLPEQSISLNSVRYRLRTKLLGMVEDFQFVGIILALTLGDSSRLAADDWQLINRTGTNHLFVISGLHIGLIAALCFWVGNGLLWCFPAFATRLPRQKCAAFLALGGALTYSLLAGFSLSTQRALVMIAVFMLGSMHSRATSVSLRYWIAMALVLSLNPLAAMNAGFWLSFLAVAALLLCLNSPRRGSEPGVAGALRQRMMANYIKPQLAVFVALCVPLVYWTQHLALLSPLVNMVAIPVVGMLVVPLCLFALGVSFANESVALLMLATADWIMAGLFEWMRLLLEHVGSWSQFYFSAVSVPVMLAASTAAVIVLLPSAVPNRLLAIPLALPLLWPSLPEPMAAELRLHILDVGQGLAVIVETRQHVLVYDTGANLSAEFNFGSAVVAPVLKRLGIERLDRIIISHADNDHAGGLTGLLAQIPANELFSSSSLTGIKNFSRSGIPNGTVKITAPLPVIACRESENWNWDGVAFRFLHPDAAKYTENNNSCVLQIHTGTHSVLLPGDIETAVERRLALRYGEGLSSSILIAPHHGSNSSSSYAFIKLVAPQFVVFSAGYRNSFRHPTARTVARYHELGAVSLNTAVTGMISFSLDADLPMPTVSRFRERYPRYWY